MQTSSNTTQQNTSQINNQSKGKGNTQKPKRDPIARDIYSMFRHLSGTGRREWQRVVVNA